VSKKSSKIEELIRSCHGKTLPAHYLGYFECFNRGLFYEAHDVLEELWLKERGRVRDGFYKGLIQFAGAFVHLQKNRLRPAVALFRLSQSYLGRYGHRFESLDVARLLSLADEWVARIETGQYEVNPLKTHAAPTLKAEPRLREGECPREP
jgi:predicted metal-dependent hydrolase